MVHIFALKLKEKKLRNKEFSYFGLLGSDIAAPTTTTTTMTTTTTTTMTTKTNFKIY
jgi:hypothetical protein